MSLRSRGYGTALRELSPCAFAGPHMSQLPPRMIAPNKPIQTVDGDEPRTEQALRVRSWRDNKGRCSGNVCDCSVVHLATHARPNPDEAMIQITRNRYRKKQSATMAALGTHHASKLVCRCQPIARDFDRRGCSSPLRTAGRQPRFASALCLDWRTRHRAVGTEHAAIARLGFQLCAAAGAFKKN